MTDYLELRCLWPAQKEEALALALDAAPILGAQTGHVGAGLVELKVFMAEDLAAEAALLGEALKSSGARNLEIKGFQRQDWLADYRASVRPFPVGDRWWIDPHPGAPTPAPRGRFRLAVEPRSAFGSGSHESTRLVLSLLEKIPVRGLRVLDVGTGSGILAMAAASLGARQVVGFDVDPGATFVARQTLAHQDVIPDVAVFAGELDAIYRASFDLILCNMISSRFLPLLDEIRGALQSVGRIVLSGYLCSENEGVREAVQCAGFMVEGEQTLEEWAGLTAVGRGQ